MGAITSVPMLFSGSEAQATYIQQAINGVDFGQVLSEMVSVAPSILPTLVTIIAFKKALRWVIGTVKGA